MSQSRLIERLKEVFGQTNTVEEASDSLGKAIFQETGGAGTISGEITDTDGDTKIETEQNIDEDIIRVTTAGVQRAQIDVNGLKLQTGADINEFSIDGTLADDSDNAAPTEKAVKTYSDAHKNSDGTSHSNVVLNDTHRGSDGKNHSDVVLNNAHRSSDGKDHSDVVLNNTHRTSDGKNHNDVVLNNTHRTSSGVDHLYIDQDVTSGEAPHFDGSNFSNIPINAIPTKDEDNMSSDSAVHVPTQQSTKAYADTKLANIIEDSTPKLGGNLNCQNNIISGVAQLSFYDGDSSVNIIRDEDDMSSDDPNALATQHSIKNYVDNNAGGGGSLDDIFMHMGG